MRQEMRRLSISVIVAMAVVAFGLVALFDIVLFKHHCGSGFLSALSTWKVQVISGQQIDTTTPAKSANDSALEKERFLEKMEQRMRERKALIRETCKKFDLQQNITHMERFMLVDKQYKAIDCSMGKTGTTRFKELFWQLMGKDVKDFTVQKYQRARIFEKERKEFLLNPTWTKSVVVREPFQRLVSAYRQKLEAPNPEFPPLSKRIHERYSPVKDGKLATFSDFINYLIAEAPRSIQTDNEHWYRYTFACTPCSIDYDFIGKQETIDEDAKYFLHLINAPKFIKHGPPNKKRSDEAMSIEYYSTVKPREKVMELYTLFMQDYIMFDYPPPAALQVLFGKGDGFWQ